MTSGHFRLLNSQSGLAIGDYPTLEAAWDAVKQNKGRMILLHQYEVAGGWVHKQQGLRYYSPKERFVFWLKAQRKKLDDLVRRIRRRPRAKS